VRQSSLDDRGWSLAAKNNSRCWRITSDVGQNARAPGSDGDRISMGHKILRSLPVLAWLAVTAGIQAAEPPKNLEFFEKKIRPVLVDQCFKCHSMNSEKLKGGLHLDTWDGLVTGGETGPAVVPGDPKKSLMMQALRHQDGLKMPPDQKLSDAVIADFDKWIRLGAPYPQDSDPPKTAAVREKKDIDWATARDFWSFQPTHNPATPTVNNANWPRTDLDRFVLSRLEAKGVQPVADADRVTLIRRLYFDLIGLPPTPEEIDRVLADKSPDAIPHLVDELLQSPHFGERWGRHWLDVARYAESNGNVDNYLFPHAWRYRDYVIAAFNADKPFDRFITEQIAGDLLPASTPAERNAQLTATGFLALTSKPRPQNNPDYAMDLVADQIEVTTVAFMGLTVACARCHDHKFDPIPQKDFYAVAAIFESSEMLFGPIDSKGNKPRYAASGLHQLQATTGSTSDSREVERAREKLESAKDRVKSFTDAARRDLAMSLRREGNAAKKLRPQAKAIAKGNIEELLNPSQQAKLKELKDAVAKCEQALAELEGTSKSDAGQAMGVTDRLKIIEGHIRIRGESQKLGDAVSRGFVTVATPGKAPQFSATHSGRLELAQWITSRDNPLTARVAVNRIWRQLFGRGIVSTVDNFGALGEPPTHPELLDHLATQFVRDGWSVKQMIRSIVLSRTYQLSTAADAKAAEVDPTNSLYWRHDARRLDGESIRDAILLVSGALDRTPGVGSMVTAQGPIEVRNGIDRKFSQYESHHRSIYLPVVRNAEPEFLVTFDLPDTELVVGDRSVTTVPAQSLYLLNSEWVVDRARGLADQVLKSGASTDAERVDHAWRIAFGRTATKEEQQRTGLYLESARKSASNDTDRTAWTLVCQALMASAEFRYVQ